MAVPGTGSTNQSLTMAAAKRLAGKAHTSNQKEIYDSKKRKKIILISYYSHSIVDGGLELISYTTLLTPTTLLIILFETF